MEVQRKAKRNARRTEVNFLNIHEPSFFNSIAIIYHLRRRVFFIMLDVYKKKNGG